MPTTAIDSAVFRDIFSTEAMRRVFSDENRIQKYLDFHQKLLGGRGLADKARAMAAAKEAGLDVARIEKDLASPEINDTIRENMKLAEDMGLNGTPSYVIGKQIVVGAVGLDGLKEKIGIARCGKATC